jgi:hypothetical protein
MCSLRTKLFLSLVLKLHLTTFDNKLSRDNIRKILKRAFKRKNNKKDEKKCNIAKDKGK